MNRMRWSSCKSIGKTLSELHWHTPSARTRPVELKFRLHDGCTALQQTFENVDAALAKLRGLQKRSTAGKIPSNLPIDVFCGCSSVAKACWMWADAGLLPAKLLAKKNPARWSSQQNIHKTLSQLRLYLGTECE